VPQAKTLLHWLRWCCLILLCTQAPARIVKSAWLPGLFYVELDTVLALTRMKGRLLCQVLRGQLPISHCENAFTLSCSNGLDKARNARFVQRECSLARRQSQELAAWKMSTRKATAECSKRHPKTAFLLERRHYVDSGCHTPEHFLHLVVRHPQALRATPGLTVLCVAVYTQM